jgi:ankyrin repeat protein
LQTKITLAEILLEKGANPDGQDVTGMTALLGAFMGRKYSLIGKLIDKKADPNVRGPNSSQSALHIACHMGLEEEAKRLLDIGADADAQDGLGRTPLHHALQNTHVPFALVAALLKKGADPRVPDRYGTSPYEMALNRHHLAVIHLFDEHMAKNPKPKPPPYRPPWMGWI